METRDFSSPAEVRRCFQKRADAGYIESVGGRDIELTKVGNYVRRLARVDAQAAPARQRLPRDRVRHEGAALNPTSPPAPAPSRPATPQARLAERLGRAFRRAELLEQALTHRSYGTLHNERLEFVGDAVLNCVDRGGAVRALSADAGGRPVADPRAPRQSRHAGASRPRARPRHGAALRRGRAPERRRRPRVDRRRRARGGVRRGVRGRRIRRRARRDRVRLRAGARRPRPRDPRQGPEDPAAGVAAGAPASPCPSTRSSPSTARRTRSRSPSSAGFPRSSVVASGTGPSRRAAEQAAAAGAQDLVTAAGSAVAARERRG